MIDIQQAIKAIKEDVIVEPVSTNYLISPRLIDLFNFRIRQERNSAYIYKAMSLWLEDKAYMNGAKLWHKFYTEELNHATWAEEFLLSLDIKPITPQVDQPSNEFMGYGDIVRKTLEHEINITNECQNLAKACMEEGNMMGYTVAHKYVSEQIEELKKAFDLLNLLEVYGEEKLNLALYDHELERFI